MSKMEFLDPVVAEKYQIWYQILLGIFFETPCSLDAFV